MANLLDGDTGTQTTTRRSRCEGLIADQLDSQFSWHRTELTERAERPSSDGMHRSWHPTLRLLPFCVTPGAPATPFLLRRSDRRRKELRQRS